MKQRHHSENGKGWKLTMLFRPWKWRKNKRRRSKHESSDRLQHQINNLQETSSPDPDYNKHKETVEKLQINQSKQLNHQEIRINQPVNTRKLTSNSYQCVQSTAIANELKLRNSKNASLETTFSPSSAGSLDSTGRETGKSESVTQTFTKPATPQAIRYGKQSDIINSYRKITSKPENPPSSSSSSDNEPSTQSLQRPTRYKPQPPPIPYESDSDESDGPILYREEPEDEDSDPDSYTQHTTGLAAKLADIQRNDTVARGLETKETSKNKLTRNPDASFRKPNPQDEHIRKYLKREESRRRVADISTMLTRRLSQRPSQDDLQQRNIFKGRQSDAEIEAKAAEIKRSLSRKLSMRPTLQQLIDRKIYVIFNEYVDIYDVDQYDRRADKPWTKLTPTDKQSIRQELNEFKRFEMPVHEQSQKYTRFHKP